MTIARKTPMARTSIRPQSIAAAQKPRVRRCAQCRQAFEPKPPGAKVCGLPCAILYTESIEAKRARKADKIRKQAIRVEKASDKARLIEMKPTKWHRKKAKTAMHAYVRARDEGKECASCDTILIKLGRIGGDYDAGHFRPVGLAKHLEFDPRNIWGQCKYCNDRLRGNFQAYEAKLRLREGDIFVDELLADNDERHLKIHDFQAIEAHYKNELKQLTEKS